MPSYIVTAIKFKCIDESGFDFFGSDEPYWVFTARDSDGNVHTTRSREFGDVDSGETRKFAENAVVWPRKGATQGAPGPIALSIQLWESDQGDKDDITRRTEQAFKLAEQAPKIGKWVKEVPEVVRNQIAELLGDDLMGSKTLLFRSGRLAKRLPHVGASFRRTLHFGGHSGDLPFEVSGGPDYDLTIQITRVA